MQDSAIKVSFFADVVHGMARQLATWGHALPDGLTRQDEATMEDVAMRYLNLERRRILPRPRAVHVAPSLQCPPSLADGYKWVLEKARGGQDLNPHLSRSIGFDASFNDQLLNDWGIHHLHLGSALEADGFVVRTNELLFAIVHFKDLYCIGVGAHGGWAQRRLLDVCDTRWPHLLAGCRVPLAGPPSSVWSEKKHKKARAKNVQVVSTLSTGEAIFAPGGGYASSGLSLDVSRRFVTILDQTHQLEERFHTLVPAILEHLAAQGPNARPPEFHLEPMPNGGYVAVDNANSIKAVLYDPDLPQE